MTRMRNGRLPPTVYANPSGRYGPLPMRLPNRLRIFCRVKQILGMATGNLPRSARDCSTVNKGGCFTVECLIPKESSSAKSCSGVFGIPALIQRTLC